MEVPAHIGIIMDGNRRWAKERGKTTIEGHQAGVDAMKRVADRALERGVKEMTVFAFSTENWKRSKEEVGALMDLFRWIFSKQAKEMHEKNIRLRVIGSREGVAEDILESIDEAEELTKDNTRGVLNMLFNYGGRRDITEAVAKIIKQGVKPEDVTEETVSESLATHGMRDLDLLMRTTEYRLSGFLPWESVYAEIYFRPDIMWPDCGEKEVDEAIDFYQQRQRRFGT